MKYLRKVILKNFQSHKHSVIEFDHGLNVIVGPSDSGKSSIIRGIKWALYNDPLGDYFIREGETETSVTLEFSNNIKVKRLRTKSRNAYILYNIEGEEIVFEGFGSKVPKEITEMLSIKKIPLDSNETNNINLGEQLEGAFLLSEKGSVRASAIGRLVGVNLIDDALKDTLKDIRNISINKKIVIESIDKIENELKAYKSLENLRENINKLEELKTNINKKIKLKNDIIKSKQVYDDIIKEKKYFNNIISKVNNVSTLETNIYKVENKNRTLKSYKNINDRLIRNKKQINYNKYLLCELRYINYLQSKIIVITNLKDKLQLLNKLKINIKNHRIEIEKFASLNDNLKGIEFIQKKSNIIEIKIDQFNKINNIKKRLDSTYKNLKTGENYIRNFKNITIIENTFSNLNKLITMRDTITKLSINLNQVKTESKNKNIYLKRLKKEIYNNLKEYENLFIENKICPFCLSSIDKNKIDHIIKHYS